MDPSRNQLLHLSEGEDDSEEEEESFGFQQCRRRKGAMQIQEMQRVNKVKRGGKGETMHSNGGRIVRATGRKDRHSKVSTARGTRDRRVRLSPNTAIQFYDVQDRLGYDRPSKAIDWLMKEAKAEIEALNNSATPLPPPTQHSSPVFPLEQQQQQQQQFLNSSVFPLENSVNTQQNPLSSQDNIFFFDWNAPNPENNPQSFTNFSHFPPVFSQREPLQSSFFPMGFSSINNEFSSLSGTRRIHGENTEEQNLSSTSILDYQH